VAALQRVSQGNGSSSATLRAYQVATSRRATGTHAQHVRGLDLGPSVAQTTRQLRSRFPTDTPPAASNHQRCSAVVSYSPRADTHLDGPAATESTLISSVRQRVASIAAQLNPPPVEHAMSDLAVDCQVHQSFCQQHCQDDSASPVHVCMPLGAAVQMRAEREAVCHYLEAMLANNKLNQTLLVGQESSMYRTMLACEGLAINFLYDHGRPASRVWLNCLL
jgi:hypothetical protein